MKSMLSSRVWVGASLALAGCLIDRGPLAGAASDAGQDDDAMITELDAAELDAPRAEDAWVEDLDAWSAEDVGLPDAGTDAPVEPDAFVPCASACDGADLVTCVGESDETRETCKLGCGPTPRAHCLEMITSNLRSATIFDLATSALDVPGPMTVDTDTMGERRTQRDGSEVSVLIHSTITIAGTLTVVGSRPLVLVARDGMTIGGTIDVSAMGATPGPAGRSGGGSPGAAASGPGNGRGGAHTGTYEDGGGGGGGQCGTGGRGGNGDSARGGDGGGETDFVGDAETLRGGGGGGAGNGDGDRYGGGGAGGGAVQLSSRGTISIGGSIFARGSEGRSGRGGSGNDGAGGGGGAGGWIIVEAPTVTIGGVIDASGGNGGSGASGGGGGLAGSSSADAAPGGDDSGGGANGGGGGGGAGCIVIRTYDPLPMTGTFRPSDAALQRLPLLLQ